MRTVVFGKEEVYAYHKKGKNRLIAIVVNKDSKEVNVVFPEGECKDKVFGYNDWLDLEYYLDRKDK